MIFNLNNLLFTKDLFESKLELFWNKICLDFTDNNHMFILFKVKYQGSDFATIGNLQRLTYNDKNWYLNWIINNMILKSEYYNETAIESFIFS
jgi:predicted nuclease of restriction endonuclease-like (RecB) superfamily